MPLSPEKERMHRDADESRFEARSDGCSEVSAPDSGFSFRRVGAASTDVNGTRLLGPSDPATRSDVCNGCLSSIRRFPVPR
jgi:hypothetical protein